MNPVYRFQNVSFGYQAGQEVLSNLTLDLPPGITLVLGPNGAGKSTFLKLAAGVEHPDAGTIQVNGHELWQEEVAARRELAYVPEQPDITPYASVGHVLEFVASLRGEPASRVAELMQIFGIAEARGRSVRELSKGQRHRVLLAAAHLGQPRVLLLDEPLSALDQGLRKRVAAWVADMGSNGGSALVITHELEPFADAAHRALVFRDGNAETVDPLPPPRPGRLEVLSRLAAGDAQGNATT